MLRLTFDKAWIDEYWSGIEPEIVQCCSEYEKMESWTIEIGQYHEINEIAFHLPVVANIPLNEQVEQHACDLLILLSRLPLKTAIAAFSWLNALGNNTYTWDYVLLVFARSVLSQGFNYTSSVVSASKILVERVQLYCSLLEFNNMFLTDPMARMLLQEIKSKLKADL